jgi:dTDP-4-amino-4,6-dideoxygalactose transaminase
MYEIPFNKPSMVGKEQEYMLRAVAQGHISGDGSFSRRCQSYLEQLLSCKKVLLTTSCTDALELSALLLDLKPGDEVIIPSFTFVSTANAFVLRGAKPIFIDIREDTLNMDDSKLAKLITEKTRAIVPVHYAGVACEMDAICELARQRGIHVVEDNAHGLMGRYRGQMLGTFGTFAAQSFHEAKNISCGEGGALVINDKNFVERAEIIREKGTDRSSFFRGEVDKYSWMDIGSSFLPSDLLAAYLLAQLEEIHLIQSRRAAIWHAYKSQLEDWAQCNNVRLPFVPKHCEQPFHLFQLIAPSVEFRAGLIEHLKNCGILAVHHYIPLHSSTFGTKIGVAPEGCKVTEYISDRLLRLPMYYSLSDEQVQTVIKKVMEYRGTEKITVGSTSNLSAELIR